MTNEQFSPDEPFDPAQRGYRGVPAPRQTYISPGARPGAMAGQPSREGQPEMDPDDTLFDPQQAGYRARPTMGQQAGAALEAGVREGVPMAAATQAAVSSLKLTAPTMNPWVMGAGFVGSGAAAYYATSQAMSGIGLRSPEQFPPQLRPAAYAGESFSASLAVLSAPYTAAGFGIKLGDSVVGNFFNSAVNLARTRPGAFAAAEGGASLSAAGGAYLAETVAPGNTLYRMGAEVTLGLTNPVNAVSWAYDKSRSLIGTVAGEFNQQNVQNKAWSWIRDTLESAGEDPETFVRILRDNNIVDPASATAAQITGSPAAAAIEAYLGKSSSAFKQESGAKLEATLDALRFKVKGLESAAAASETPEGAKTALKLAAEVKYEYYQALITGRVTRANNEAVNNVNTLIRNNPDASASEISAMAREALDNSLKDVRAVEADLWNNISAPGQFSTTNLRQAVDEIYSQSAFELRAEKIPERVLRLLERSEAGDPPVTFTDLKDFRSWLLENSRSAVEAGRSSEASRLGQLAESILDDIDDVMVTAGNRAYDEARMFSRRLNDVYTRSYAGKAVAVGKYGDRIPPEVLLRRATAGGDEQVVLQLEDLSRATSFLDEMQMGTPRSAQNISDMNDAQDQFVRLLAAASRDPKTGLINPDKLRDFSTKRKELLTRFPGVKADIDNAIKGGDSLLRWQESADALYGIVRARPMTKIMGSDAVTVSRKAVISGNRASEIEKLAKFAKGGATNKRGVQVVSPQQAMDDLRQSMINAVSALASPSVADRGNVLDIGRFRSIMFDVAPDGQRPLADILVEKGVFDQSHVANMKKITNAFEAAISSTQPPSAITIQTTPTERMVRAATKVLGSWMGASTRKVTGGPGNIILATEGSNLAQDILLRMPAANTMKMVEKLMANPEMLQLVSSRGMTPALHQEKVGRFYSWVIQSGLTEGAKLGRPTYEDEPEAPELFTQPR